MACAMMSMSMSYAAHPDIAASPTEIADAAGARPVKMQQNNPYAVEVYFDDNTHFTLDFYGENIFRLFQDNKGGIIRNPKAEPEAEILVKNPRKTGFKLQLQTTDADFIVATPRLTVSIDRRTGLLRVKDGEREVLQQTGNFQLEENKTSFTLACHEQEYFYGGGVQNGRFSHRGESIAIENTNNWVDGGVASPTPFYWSTAGYGVMWHTFKPGRYDFGAEQAGTVALSHDEGYLDVFFFFDEQPTQLLNDFYQLTGNPILMPKFGFYEGHLNAYNRDYWTPAEEGKKGFMTYEDGKAYNESQKDNGGVRESLNG